MADRTSRRRISGAFESSMELERRAWIEASVGNLGFAASRSNISGAPETCRTAVIELLALVRVEHWTCRARAYGTFRSVPTTRNTEEK